MADTPLAASAASSSDFVAAVESHRIDAALAILADHAAAVDDASFQRAVDGLIKTRRWADAAELLQRSTRSDAATTLKRNLARNMVALQTHRPGTYEAMIRTLTLGRYRLVLAADGRLTIGFIRPNAPGAEPQILSDRGQPSKGLERLTPIAADPRNRYHVFGLLGAGDGYLITWMTQHPNPDEFGIIQPVFVIEPETEVLFHAMMIHDWTGPAGPIEQRRFLWMLGPSWAAENEPRLQSEPQLKAPSLEVTQSLIGKQIHDQLAAIIQRRKAADEKHRQNVQAYYAGLSRDHWLDVLGNNPSRRPRVLCVTTRFSTVVQYVARDLTEAMSRAGWDAELLMEKEPHHAVLAPALLAKLDEFKPDMVVAINHLRAETTGVFPSNLPYVCWIQDHMPALMDSRCGAALTPRDFVLGEANAQYIERFGYPARQCLPIAKLTRAVPSLPRETQSGNGLVFVSNASGNPAQLFEELCAQKPERPEWARLLERCGRELLELYTAGGCCATTDDMHHIVRSTALQMGLPVLTDAQRDLLCQKLYNPLNNALYRQQTLDWIVPVAERMGLSLNLYGSGWESHPRFSRFARGRVNYGHDLDELTRRSRINFQIVPYAFYHQRLFDGLMAGGFFLIRANPADRRHGDYLISTGVIPDHLPAVDRVSFDSEETLANRMAHFLQYPQECDEIVALQRKFVEQHLTYDARVRPLVKSIRDLIAAEQ